MPQDPETRFPYPVGVLRDRWPHTLAYLHEFEDALKKRSGYKRYFKSEDPFYAIYNVGRETLSEWKAVWRTMSATMDAAVIGPSAAADAHSGQKPGVFKNTVIFVAVESEREADYLAALLNSTWVNYIVRASNVRGGKSANATNVLSTIAIPKFSAKRPTHRRLAELGHQARENVATTQRSSR